jgi:hypothetical protein
MMGARTIFISALCRALPAVVVLGVAVARPEAVAAEGCGVDAGRDWLCRDAGEVHLGVSTVRGTGPRQVQPKERVWVGPAGAARMTYGEQAVCSLGAVSMPTVLVSRYRGSLFLQRNGSTTCQSLLGQGDRFGVFCRRTTLCPVEVSVTGRVLTEWRPRPPGNARLAYPRNREIRLWFCATSYRVAVRRGGRGSESSGEAGGSSSLPELALVRIVETGSYGLGIFNEGSGELCDPTA